MREHHLRRGNLLWEGSRMMLPEHREGLLDRRREQRKQDMPDLDEDQQTIIDQAIGMSLYSKSEITLTIYNPFEDRRLMGYVVRIDQHRGRVLLQTDEGDEWIKLLDIIKAEKMLEKFG